MMFGESQVRLGNDGTAYSDSNGIVKTGIVDGGLFELAALPAGRYLTIRRDGPDPIFGMAYYYMNEIRVYQTPNLFEALLGVVSVTADTSPAETGF